MTQVRPGVFIRRNVATSDVLIDFFLNGVGVIEVAEFWTENVTEGLRVSGAWEQANLLEV